MRTRSILTACLVATLPLAAGLPGGSMILAILGIGFLIFIHEWGHFAACRLTDTRTETFSIGFGPRLFGWEKDREGKRRFTTGARQLDPDDHAMDFRIAAIPLGGYVKMAGEIPGESTTGAPDEFPQKTAGQRAFIISAGVIMNLITAIVFYSLTYAMGKSTEPPIAGTVPAGSAAWAAGIQPGDQILNIDGNPIENVVDLLTEGALAPKDRAVPVHVRRDGEDLAPIDVLARFSEADGRMRLGIGASPKTSIKTGETELHLAPGATVTVNGIPARSASEATDLIYAAFQATGGPVTVLGEDGTSTVLGLTPPAGDDMPKKLRGRIGIALASPAKVGERTAAVEAALQEGDELVGHLDNEGNAVSWLYDGERKEKMLAPGAWTGLLVRRGGSTLPVDVPLETVAARRAFFAGVELLPQDDAIVAPVPAGGVQIAGDGVTLVRVPTAPAKDAGLEPGSKLLKVGADDVASFREALAHFENVKPGADVELTVRTPAGEERVLKLTAAAPVALGRLDIVVDPQASTDVDRGLGGAVALGAKRTWREIVNVFRTIGAFFTGRVSFAKNVAGPITIVDVSRRSADRGSKPLLWFLAYVSVMLAVLNILPIPILDGGHLLFILIEKIKGSPLKDETMFNLQKVGMVLLLILMFFAFKNDITRVFFGG